MQKPGFGVVTSVVTALCVIGFVATILRPRIPAVVANRMSNEHAEFLRQGQNEAIDWKTMTRASMAEARRAGKPILLVVGTPTSRVAYVLDQQAFADREVAGYLRRNFFCMRVDGAGNPAWLNAFLPFKRLSLGFQCDLQIWVLDPTGVPFDYLVRSLPDQSFDERAMLPILIDLRNKFDALNNHHASKDNLQRAEAEELRALVPKPIPFEEYSKNLMQTFDPAANGFAMQGIASASPMSWRYLMLTGNGVQMEMAFQTTFHSPMVDLLDGGFFHTMLNGPNEKWVEFDKKPVENAEAMLTLAQANAISPDPNKLEMLESTWNYLVRFGRTKGRFVAGQYGAENPLHRSDRYSFASSRLRESVSPQVHDWAINNLGLNVARFPQAVPFRQTEKATGMPLMLALEDMRDAIGPAPKLAEPGLADINLTCAARAIQTARILGSRDRLDQAVGWLEDLEVLRDGDDVNSSTEDDTPQPGYLGDYLAYSDARLQDYLTTGHVRSFEMGLAVLRRAQLAFAGIRPGMLVLNSPARPWPLPNTTFPEVADNLHEACTARAIRLLLAYGRLLGDTAEGAEMQARAHAGATLFGQVAVKGGPMAAGFFCAAAEDADRAFAVAVGPEAQQTADSLARRLPTRLVAPAFGSVRQDLQRRAPGIYIVRDGIEGPFTVDQVVSKLSPVLTVVGAK